MAEESNAPSISAAVVERTHIDQSGTPTISAAIVNRIRDIDAAAPSEDSRAVLSRMEKNLLATYDSLIRKAESESESSPPLLSSNDCNSWIVKECKVQRYWDSNRKVPVSRQELEAGFLDGFLVGAKLNSNSYRAALDDQSDLVWIIRVEGLPGSVQIFCAALDKWLNYKINHHNFKLTAEKGEPVNITFDPLKPLGANLVQVRNHNDPLGLLIQAKEQPESQFAQSVGNRTYRCATVDHVKTAGNAPTTTFKFKELVEVAKENGKLMEFTIKCLSEEYSGLLWCREEEVLSGVATETAAVPAQANLQGKESKPVCFTSPVEQSGCIQTGASAKVLQEEQVIGAIQGTAMLVQCQQDNTFVKDENDPANVAHLQRQDNIEPSPTNLSSEVNSDSQRNGDNGDYSLFYDKLSSLVELEFRDGGNMHKNSAMGILWARHKKLFGLACSDSCPCVQRLCHLTETVVTDMLRKKHSKWDNPMNLGPGDYPVGIAGNFAATFLPLLQQEHPNDGASKLLERLLSMWQIHQKQRIFGLQCKEGCLCLQGWEIAFEKGTLPGECKPQIELKECNRNTLGAVPKKRKAAQISQELAIEKKSKFLADTGKPTSQSSPSAGSVLSSKHNHLDNITEQQPFEIVFDCNQPLGFYCVTEKGPRKYCKVISVCPYKTNMDPRIHAETEVLCTGGSQSNFIMPVRTHNDLKSHYEEARLKGVSLCITFTNNGLPDADVLQYKASFFPREWQKNDHLWIGKCRTGFDGGAGLVHQCNMDAVSSLKLMNSMPGESQHSQVKTYSIGEKSETKKVQFSESVECRTYEVGSLPSESLQKNCTVYSTSMTKSSESALEENSLKHHPFNPKDDANFVATSNIGKFLEWLEYDGGLENYRLDQMNELLAHFKEQFQVKQLNDTTSKHSKSELDLKYALLKIHVNAAHAIQLSKSLKNWTRLHIFVEKLDCIQFQCIHPQPNTTIDAEVSYLGEGRMPEPLQQLPTKPVVANCTGQNEIVYSDTTPPYQVNYNPVMTKNHAIEIKLIISNQVSGKPVHSGVIRFALAEIHQCCLGNRVHQNIYFWASTQKHLKSARLCLKVMSEQLDRSCYIEEKHKKVNKIIKNIIEWTARFQEDLAAYNVKHKVHLHSLGTDLKIGSTGLTLLHAAIYLRNADFVCQLLDLGAKYSSGPALTFAVNMADCFGKMKMPARGSNNSGAADDMDTSDDSVEGDEVQPSKQYDKIVHLLHDYRNSALSTLQFDDGPNSDSRDSHHCNQSEAESMDACVEEVHSSISTRQTLTPTKQSEAPNVPEFFECSSAGLPETRKVENGTKLPVLTNPDWLPQVRRCKYWSRNGWCRKGMTCNFVHRYGPWGDRLEQIWKEMSDHGLPFDTAEFNQCVHFLAETINGFVWHTAGFANISAYRNKLPGIVIYSEGGNARISTQGLSWYQSKEDAYVALEMAFMVSLRAGSQNGTQSSADHLSNSYRHVCLNQSDCLITHEQNSRHKQYGNIVRRHAHNDCRVGHSDHHHQHKNREMGQGWPGPQRATSLQSQNNWCYSEMEAGDSQKDQSNAYTDHRFHHGSYPDQPGSSRFANSDNQHSWRNHDVNHRNRQQHTYSGSRSGHSDSLDQWNSHTCQRNPSKPQSFHYQPRQSYYREMDDNNIHHNSNNTQQEYQGRSASLENHSCKSYGEEKRCTSRNQS